MLLGVKKNEHPTRNKKQEGESKMKDFIGDTLLPMATVILVFAIIVIGVHDILFARQVCVEDVLELTYIQGAK